MAREILFDLGKMITDRLPYKFGIKRLTENDPEYIILDRACSSDEIAEVMLKMELRKPKTTAEIAKLTGKSEEHIVELLTDAANHGIVEYNFENPKHEKQWYVQLFVPGIAEMTNMVLWQVEKYPELADSFNKMTFLPLEGKTHLIPPGGDGVGMHVIPVEKAIPAKNESASIEHISHWLDKYDGHFSVGYCSCRNARRLFGEGSGEIQDDCCIGLGDFADYLVETGKGRYITREEVLQICQRAEENGYVHQVTNIDGSDKIFGLCNCDLGVCFALRTSQYFNTPNLSASAYRAHVDKDNCVACGKCVEVCPAGAVKLGQKLCTKNGEVAAPRPARLPARLISPSRATSSSRRKAVILMRSSSSSRTTPSPLSAAMSATAAARLPARAALLTRLLPSTRSKSSSPSRTSRAKSVTSPKGFTVVPSISPMSRRSPSSAPALPV